MRLSAGATSFSPPPIVELGDTGKEDMRGTWGGMWAAEPPSAVLTVISGDIATIISSVEDGFSASSGNTIGARLGWRRAAVAGSSAVGVLFICNTSHIRGMLRWIFEGSQSKSTFSDPDAMRVILSRV